jgi:hypothetical protein
MILSKYAVAAIQTATLIVTALVAALNDDILTAVESWQIVVIAIGSITAIWVPLSEKGWAGILKFGATVLGAAASAVVPIIDTANGGPGWNGTALLIVVLAGLNAALTALGVQARLDSAKAALVAPDVSDRVPATIDGKAVKVVLASGSLGADNPPQRSVG